MVFLCTSLRAYPGFVAWAVLVFPAILGVFFVQQVEPDFSSIFAVGLKPQQSGSEMKSNTNVALHRLEEKDEWADKDEEETNTEEQTGAVAGPVTTSRILKQPLMAPATLSTLSQNMLHDLCDLECFDGCHMHGTAVGIGSNAGKLAFVVDECHNNKEQTVECIKEKLQQPKYYDDVQVNTLPASAGITGNGLEIVAGRNALHKTARRIAEMDYMNTKADLYKKEAVLEAELTVKTVVHHGQKAAQRFASRIRSRFSWR